MDSVRGNTGSTSAYFEYITPILQPLIRLQSVVKPPLETYVQQWAYRADDNEMCTTNNMIICNIIILTPHRYSLRQWKGTLRADCHIPQTHRREALTMSLAISNLGEDTEVRNNYIGNLRHYLCSPFQQSFQTCF